MIQIERLEHGPVTVLRFTGDVDEEGADAVRAALLGCVKDRRCNIVVNMEKVEYVSYMGLGVLVERLRQVRAFNGDMKLAGVNLYTKRLLRMVGAKNVFDIWNHEGEAVQAYAQAA